MESNRRRVPVMLAVLLLAVLLLLALLFFVRGRAVSAMALPDPEGLDARAVSMMRPLWVFKHDPEEFSYRVSDSITYPANSSESSLRLESPYKNHCLMVLELVLDETGEVVCRTGYLKPGQRLEGAPLETALTPGEYAATAELCAVDAETFELLGILEQPVTLIVEG